MAKKWQPMPCRSSTNLRAESLGLMCAYLGKFSFEELLKIIDKPMPQFKLADSIKKMNQNLKSWLER